MLAHSTTPVLMGFRPCAIVGLSCLPNDFLLVGSIHHLHLHEGLGGIIPLVVLPGSLQVDLLSRLEILLADFDLRFLGRGRFATSCIDRLLLVKVCRFLDRGADLGAEVPGAFEGT